jgi:hypothetical protein
MQISVVAATAVFHSSKKNPTRRYHQPVLEYDPTRMLLINKEKLPN